jgi:hypothetical protein
MLALKENVSLSLPMKIRVFTYSMAKFMEVLMRIGTKRKQRNTGKVAMSGLALFLIICLFLLSGCSGSAKSNDHPFALGTPGDQGGSATEDAGTPSSGIPIVVVQDQSTLSTYPGGFMNMTVTTAPFAVCNFLVYYGLSTPSKTYGIVPVTANADGLASWKWQVDPAAHTGNWPLKITATLPNGQQSTQTIDVTVTLPPISVVSSQSILTGAPKSQLKLMIQTAPNVNCSLLLNFGPGSSSKTLKARTGSQGLANWTWNIPKDASPGVWPLTVTVTLQDGESTAIQVNETIQS